MSFSDIINLFLEPVSYLALMLLLMAITIYRKKDPLRPFIAFVLLLFFFVSPVSLWINGWWEGQYPVVVNPEKKDAAVIMGGGTMSYYMEDHQHLYYPTVGRTLEALKLYRQGFVKKIVVSGGDPGGVDKGALGEAPSMVMFLRQTGVPEGDILVEDKSLNTYDEAVFLKDLLPRWGIKSFYLVTSAFHMKRSMDSFAKQGLIGLPYPVLSSKNTDIPAFFQISRMAMLKNLLHEWVGLLSYKMRGRI